MRSLTWMFFSAGGLNSVEKMIQYWGKTAITSPRKYPLTFKLITTSFTWKGFRPGYFLRYLAEQAMRFSLRILENNSWALPIFLKRTCKFVLNSFADGLSITFLGSDSRYQLPLRKWLAVRKFSWTNGDVIWIELKQLQRALKMHLTSEKPGDNLDLKSA